MMLCTFDAAREGFFDPYKPLMFLITVIAVTVGFVVLVFWRGITAWMHYRKQDCKKQEESFAHPEERKGE